MMEDEQTFDAVTLGLELRQHNRHVGLVIGSLHPSILPTLFVTS